VVGQLHDMLRDSAAALGSDPDDRFHAQQNARVVRNAEAYYRAAFSDHTDSWNLRDTHMMDTLQALRDHLRERLGRLPRIAVWAHNSHLGDARATEPAEQGQINLGQLVRERWGDDDGAGGVRLVGFTTHGGTVTAASDWDEPAELKTVRPSLDDSVERLLHDSGHPMFLLALHGEIAPALAVPRLERAIGVIYRPETERWSHYFYASLSEQFDCVIHVDETRAVSPLDPSTAWVNREEPETYPSGI
jgi:erythromycin esterase-like protein